MDEITDLRSGLSTAEAAGRLRRDGANVLPDPERRSFWRIVVEVVREPMFLLLLAGGAIYLAIGEPKEALVLLAFASLSVLIAVVQGLRSERVLDALRDLTQPLATVVREGERRRIASAELVKGDLIEIAEGERIAADAVLRQGQEVQADESLLTGESAPVAKSPTLETVASAPPEREDGPFLYSGALVVRGQGLAEVIATGPRTELGKIGRALKTVATPPGRLALETGQMVRIVGGVGIAVCAAVVILYGLLRGSWLKGILSGIAVGMAMLPEEFPLVLGVFMVMGAWRISRAKVLTRRPTAIESLGSATVLCADKTGTLTQNQMAVARIWTPGGAEDWSPGAPVPAAVRAVLEAGVLASSPQPFDPMEVAFHSAARALFVQPTDWELDQRFGVAPGRLAVTHVWRVPGAVQRQAYVKGAAETVLDLCRADEVLSAEVIKAVDAMATAGLRVLAVAAGETPTANPVDDPGSIAFRLLGLVGLADPLRPDVPAAVRLCRSAGIRVVMITGDYPATARAIAVEAGLGSGELVTGEELRRLGDRDLAEKIGRVTVFARILPEQKLRIVQALQARGEVVAMTGDGVNDAPALKAADIGIAMGGRGADVAREASALILLNDDFGSIVKAVRLGRRIYDNLQKAMSFIVSVHVPIAGLAVLPLVFGLPMILAPAHIALLEMIIDPVCAIVFEAESEEDDVMRRPPRPSSRSLFTPGRIMVSLAEGLLVFAIAAGVFAWGISAGREDAARTQCFVALAGSFILLAQVNRRFRNGTALFRINPAFLWVAGVLAVVIASLVAWPTGQALFEFAPLGLSEATVVLIAVLTAAAGLVVVKWTGARARKTGF